MSTYLQRATAFAAAALLALAVGFGLATAPQAYANDATGGGDKQFVAQGLSAQETSEIAYDGDAVQFVKDNLTDTFGMLSSTDLVVERAGGKVHVTFTPSNRAVYSGFYLKAAIGDVPAKATYPVEGFAEESWVGAKGEVESFTYDFELDESYCGFAWPVAPIKTEARGGGTTSSQYYLAIPAADKIPEAAPKDNPMKTKAKTVKVKAKKLKKKAQKVVASKAITVTGAQGKVSYKLTKISAKKKLAKQAKKKIKVGGDGKITLKKGLKKGTYKVTIAVTAAGTSSYKAATQNVTVKIKVK